MNSLKYLQIALMLSVFAAGSVYADSIDDVIDAEMKRRNIPGLSLVIIDGGKIVKAKGYGVTEKGGNTAVTTSTLFQAGSISKPVAAVGALHLVEQGKLALDADVNTRLTSWKVPENEFTKEKKVTLRGILSHSAGLTVHGFPGYASDAPKPTVLQILNGEKPANTPPIRVSTVPGSILRYSGGGYTVMQQMMVDVTGKPFADFMREKVLAPFGMRDSDFTQPLSAGKSAIAASGHLSGRNVVPGRWHTYPEMAAAGLWTTSTDLARFALGVQQSLAGTANPVLSAAMTREMLTVQKNMGLGFALDGTDKAQEFSHGGRDEGFDARLVATAATGQGAVIMINANDNSRMMNRIMTAIRTTYKWPAAITDAATRKPTPTIIEADLKVLGLVSGRYEVGNGRMLTLVREKNSLVTMSDGLPDEQYLPIGALRFYSVPSDEEFAFSQDEKGQVTVLTARSKDRERKAVRLGPLMHTLKPQTDPDAARTEKLKQALLSCGQGGNAVADSAYFAASTKTAFGSRALPECIGVKAVTFLSEQDLSDRVVERHGSKVQKLLMYKVTVARPAQFLLVFLDQAGRIADLDMVED